MCIIRFLAKSTKKGRSIKNSLHFPAITILLGLILANLILWGECVDNATAQSNELVWSPPVNLSKSGSTSQARVMIDSEGWIHVLWKDEFTGIIYSFYDGDTWSQPEPGLYPVYLVNLPKFVQGSDGEIYAFWITQNDTLYSARLDKEYIGNYYRWRSVQAIAREVVDFSVEIESGGIIHAAYISSSDDSQTSSGMFYRRSDNSGNSWGSEQLIYPSLYFRSLTKEISNLQITSAPHEDTTSVYLVWDDPFTSRVFLNSSIDGGITWNDSQEIDQPLSNGLTGPLDINVSAIENSIFLTWQNEDPESGCAIYQRVSHDDGKTWERKQTSFELIDGCVNNYQFMGGKDNLLIFAYSTDQQQIVLIAWDGKKWSKPQIQNEFQEFIDPKNNSLLQLDSFDLDYSEQSGLLTVVGNDTTENTDVWITSRHLGGVQDWFPSTETIWGEPQMVTTVSKPIISLKFISDDKNKFYAFWTQESESPQSDERPIYTISSEKEAWSSPQPLFQFITKKPNKIDVAISQDNRLFLVWDDLFSGEIYFSWAHTERANSAFEWSEPFPLPIPRQAGRSPDIIIRDSKIYVTYSIPLNEQRGIYLTSSEDGGESWTEPTQIFDGVKAGWEMVDEPKLACPPGDIVYAIWTRYSLPDSIGPLELHYARSDDEGAHWSDANHIADGMIAWSEVTSQDDKILHHIWLDLIPNRSGFRHEYSSDGGITWSPPDSIALFEETQQMVGFTQDPTGGLHLVQIHNEAGETSCLSHWNWGEGSWHKAGSFCLEAFLQLETTALDTTISPEGHFGVIFSVSSRDEETETLSYQLLFTTQTLELPKVIVSSPTPTIKPTLPPPQTHTPTPTTTATPLVLISEPNAPQSGMTTKNNSWSGALIATGLAGLVSTLAFGLYWFLLRPSRR